MKTTVFNLIILDESGSMSGVTKQTISGCNEAINVAKAAAEKNHDTLRSLMSVYAFQDGGPVKSRYILKNEDAAKACHITGDDYKPLGNTPFSTPWVRPSPNSRPSPPPTRTPPE